MSFVLEWAHADAVDGRVPWRSVASASGARGIEDELVTFGRAVEGPALLRVLREGRELLDEVCLVAGGELRLFFPCGVAGRDAEDIPSFSTWPDAWARSSSGARMASGLQKAIVGAWRGLGHADRAEAQAFMQRVIVTAGWQERVPIIISWPLDKAAAAAIRRTIPFGEVAHYLSTPRAPGRLARALP